MIVDEHRPSRAMRRAAANKLADTPASADRPLWLLRKPLPLPALDFRGAQQERLESGWWDDGDQRRDYPRVVWQQPSAWVFRDRDSDRWFLRGSWALPACVPVTIHCTHVQPVIFTRRRGR